MDRFSDFAHSALKADYDFAVIGAGPAGLTAALNLAGKGHSVALLDKRDPWREPVACAEAVHAKRLHELVPRVESDWIREPVDGVIFVSPNGTRVRYTLPGSGYLIDRALMHYDLAKECQSRGVHCNFKSRVTEVGPYREGRRLLSYEGETPGRISACVVIDAGGPGAGFGKGEDIVQGDLEVEPALFALVEGLEFPPTYIQLLFGKNYAPGGYAWLFPRDEKVANVGLVIGRKHFPGTSARKYFKELLEKTYPGAKVLNMHGGSIPCGYRGDKPFAVDNLFKAGDAANMVHPISRAGIVEAMTGGELAADAALKVIHLEHEAQKRPHYARYQSLWEARYGRHHGRMFRAKAAFVNIDDEIFDRAAGALARLPENRISMGRICLATLWASPSLLWNMRSLFWPPGRRT